MAIETIQYWRHPTPAEINFGYGCRHYRGFTIAECRNQYGLPKRWLKADGQRWNRG